MTDEAGEVLIVGAGAIGVCAAYYLHRRGCRVSLIERGEIASGASKENAGLVVPSHCIPFASPGAIRYGLKSLIDSASPFYIKPQPRRALLAWLNQFRRASSPARMAHGLQVLRQLNYASKNLFDRLIAELDLDCDYRQAGWLFAYTSAAGFREGREEAALLGEHDVPAQIFSSQEAREFEPGLAAEIEGGVYYPDDAHLNPEAFVRGLADWLQAQGVTIHTNTQALGFDLQGGAIAKVRTDRGDFRPAQVVLAAGAWTPQLLKPLGIELLVEAAKGYSLTIPEPETGAPRVPLYLSEAKVAVTPLPGRLRFAGTLEMCGLDLSINARRVETIRRSAGRYLKTKIDADAPAWSGLRPCSPDGLPVIERSPQIPNLIVAAGHCMLGITLAPVTGKLVAGIVAGEPYEALLTSLRSARFTSPRGA